MKIWMLKRHKLFGWGGVNHLYKDTIIALLLKISGSLLMLLLSVVAARVLGTDGVGLYFLAITIATVVSIIGRVGLDGAMLRFIANYYEKREWAGISSVYRQGMLLTVFVSGVLTILMYSMSAWFSLEMFGKQSLQEPLKWASLSIVPFAILNIQAESFKGIGKYRSAMVLQGIIVPLFAVLWMIPLAMNFQVTGAMIAYVMATLISAVIGMWMWKKANTWTGNSEGTYPFEALWRSCQPQISVTIINGAILPWMPLLLLAVWSTEDEIGIFGAALRLSMMVSFFLIAVNNVIVPKFSGLYASGEITKLADLARFSVKLLTFISAPVVIVMIVASDWIMYIYGESFMVGGLVLSILGVGQLINVLCGPAGYILIMSGNELLLSRATTTSFILQLALCIVLIPSFGMTGAATASMAGVIMNNVLSVYYIRKRLEISYPWKIGKGY